MAVIQSPETAVCFAGVTRTDTGAMVSPATSMKITIYDPSGVVVANAQDMTSITPVTIGGVIYNYKYSYQTTSSTVIGKYRVRYIATNGTDVTIQDDSFTLETSDA